MTDPLYAIFQILRISTPTVLESLVGRVTMAKCDERLHSWANKLVRHAEIDLTVNMPKDIDWSRAYVIMSNHQSHYDTPVLYKTVPGSMRSVAKKELFRVPIWGQAMRESGFICIDRQDREKAIASLKGAVALLDKGTHIWISPEGTRSRTGNLGELKKGGFHLAIDAGVSIIPVALRGTSDINPPKSWTVRRGQKVTVTFGSPIPTQGASVSDLMNAVRSFFLAHLPESRP